MNKLAQEDIDQKLSQFPDWSLIGDSMQRTFSFENFVDAMSFVNRVADLAEGASLSLHEMVARLQKQYAYIFRTFTNSFEVNDGTGGRLVVIPSYEREAKLRPQAESAYRQAYGSKVVLESVNAELLAHANGSLRCITVTIPQSPQ